MTTLREAAQQALEALGSSLYPQPRQMAAIAALKAALAQPAPEPVAWMVYTPDGKSVCVTDNPADFTEQHRALPLYTAPPQRKPLTERQIARITANFDARFSVAIGIARAVEAAHGIKE